MDTSFLIVKMIGALTLILGLMGIILWGLKRFGNLKISPAKGLIEVIENRAFAPKRLISLIRIGKNYYLVASTDTQITLIDTIDAQSLEGFRDILNKELEKGSHDKKI